MVTPENSLLLPTAAIVMPCYNEAGRLKVDRIISFLTVNPGVTILLVNDGSTDGTHEIIEKLAAELPAQISTLHLHRNSGKAQAVRAGMLKLYETSEAPWFGYWDADLAAPLDEIQYFLTFARPQTMLLMGSRIKRMGSDVSRSAVRHISGRIMATFISWTLGLGIYDTQCGAKLICRKVIPCAFTRKFISQWLFDVEIIARLMAAYPELSPGSYLYEVPVCTWKDVKGSKVKFVHMLNSLVELIRIRFCYPVHGKNRTAHTTR